MRKKLLSLLLTLSLLLSLCPAALAADDVRETDFFTDQEHADVNFADMEYEHIDGDAIQAEMDAIAELAADEANAAEVEERFNGITDEYMNVLTMYTLISIRTDQNVYDEEAMEEHAYTWGLYYDMWDGLALLIKAILESPCAAFLEAQLSEADVAFYLSYGGMPEEEKELSDRETALTNEYKTLAASITVEVDGKEWTENSAYSAYLQGEISYEEYDEISLAYVKKQNEVLGELYLRMVDVRQEIAQYYGYDNYTEYAYEAIYQRDYTPEEIQAFHQAAKKHVYPLYSALNTLFNNALDEEIFYADYSSDIALDMMEPYIGQMSSELKESFDYMCGHGLYDSGFGDYKNTVGYTTMINGYGAPFYFNSPYGNLYDFTTAVHEFGHYNNFYWQPNGWNDGSKSIDLAEVHSQGLELLFSYYYPEIFGENSQFVLDYQLSNMVSILYQGSIHDELQQFVYSTDDLTVQKINEKYRQLAGEYGIVAADDPRTEMYSWCTIPHTFTSPCYYISYAVSAAGALAFWLDAQEDYFTALDKYLEFTALDYSLNFQESFETLGMDSPISPAYMEELVDTLWTALDVKARLEAIQPDEGDEDNGTVEVSFSDVTEANWFYEYVMALASEGYVTGYEDGAFQPQYAATWSMLAEFLDISDKDPDAAITRLEFCQVLAEDLELSTENASPLADTDDAAVAALAELGIISGYADGTFRPDGTLTRAELCAALCRAILAAADKAA